MVPHAQETERYEILATVSTNWFSN
jgi:hypothetical protein